MSYIRMGQEGTYVDIPGGSHYYLYDNGSDIDGWSHEEFAAIVAEVLDEIEWETEENEDGEPVYSGASGNITHKIAQYFGGLDYDYKGGIAPPERAEIFCQVVDRRLEESMLTPGLHRAMREWAEENTRWRECEYCGEEFRPYVIFSEETTFACSKDECDRLDSANTFGLSPEEYDRYMALDDAGEAEAYLEEHSEHFDE